MIESVAVVNSRNERLDLVLTDPWSSGFVVKSISGLGPAKGSVNVTDISSSDGAVFNSSRVGTRNIVLTLGFVSDHSIGRDIETVRHLTYKYFPVKKPLRLYIKTDKRHLMIDGYVESNEPDIFSQNEGCEISIICPDPYFYKVRDENGGDTLGFDATEGGFFFVFSNEHLSDPRLHFADIKLMQEKTVDYQGETDTGVFIRAHFTGNVENLYIVKTSERKSMLIDTSRLGAVVGGENKFISGDDLLIDTRVGHKSVKLIRNSMEYNIINCVDLDADWLTLVQGDNTFSYRADVGPENMDLRIEYFNVYEGV